MNQPPADLQFDEQDGQLLVFITGEIDLSNAATIGEHICTAAGDNRPVQLNLAGVQFCDSQGLRMFHQTSTALAETGGSLTILVPPDSIVGRLLTMTSMDALLTVRAL